MLNRFFRLYRAQRLLWYYTLLIHAAVLGLLAWKLAAGQWGHAGLCALTLVLFQLPAFAEATLPLHIPPLLEVLITAFAIAANILGEMLELYLRIPGWDAGLHAVWGFLAALLGSAVPGILDEGGGRGLLRPWAAALFALSFATLSGVLWEFFEYFMDSVFHMDMQKDVWIHTISSVLRNPSGANVAVTEEIHTLLVNGEAWPAYLDVGLRDTMNDMLLNFLGSVIASALLYVRAGNRGRLRFLRHLIPSLSERGEHEKD